MRNVLWVAWVLLAAGPSGTVAPQSKNPQSKKAPAEEADSNEAEFEKLKALFDAEKGKEPYERIATIEKFGTAPAKGSVPFLIAILKEEKGSPPIVAATVRALGKIGSSDAVTAIVQLGVPVLVGDINIASLASALSTPLEDAAEDWLIKNGLTEAVRKNREAMRIMVEAIASLRSEKRIAFLQGELKRATTPEAKVLFLHAIRDSRPKGAAKVVRPFLRDPEAQVQVAVLQVLLEVETKEYAREYPALLRSPHWEVRALAVELLALDPPRDIVKLLIPLLTDPEYRVRVTAIQVLSTLGGDAVVDPMIRALDKNEGRVLDDLADALARLTGKDFGTRTAQWESWWATNKGQVKVARRTAEEFAKVKAEGEKKVTGVAAYFGMRVISKNLTFIIDCSDSMAEGYEPLTTRKETPVERPAPGEEGKTVAQPGKAASKKKGSGKASPVKRDLTPKIEVAKRELTTVLRNLSNGVMVNIIRFNSTVQPWKNNLIDLDPVTKKDAEDFVAASKPEGLTNLYAAIEEALKDKKLDTIFLLSDGAPTLGMFIDADDVLAAVAKLNQLRKVKINTIGINLRPEEVRLMEALADQNYGVFVSR